MLIRVFISDFENEEIQNENISELLADCINEATAESSSSKDDDTPLSNLVIDPDNGEVSAAQHEVTPKLDIESCLEEKERVPSPASNVEIEMSEVKTLGLLGKSRNVLKITIFYIIKNLFNKLLVVIFYNVSLIWVI